MAKQRAVEGIKLGMTEAQKKVETANRNLMLDPNSASAKMDLANAKQEVGFWQNKLKSMYPGDVAKDDGPSLFMDSLDSQFPASKQTPGADFSGKGAAFPGMSPGNAFDDPEIAADRLIQAKQAKTETVNPKTYGFMRSSPY